MLVREFLQEWHPAITNAVLEQYPPVYNAAARRNSTLDLSVLARSPLLAQADAIRAGVLQLSRGPAVTVVGEMGVGKTYVGTAIGALMTIKEDRPKRTLIVGPPHLTAKWKREIDGRNAKGQVEAKGTDPNGYAVIVKTPADLRAVVATAPADKNLYVILSREQAKLGYGWRPVVTPRQVKDEYGDPITVYHCPGCFGLLADEEGVPVAWKWIKGGKRKCNNKLIDVHGTNSAGMRTTTERECGAALWSSQCKTEGVSPFLGSPVTLRGPRRVAMSEYIHRNFKGYFDLLIVDEAHEYKADDSAQGFALGLLAGSCKKIQVLTGTLLGGYASTLFYLLYRFSPEIRRDFGYRDESKWVSRYGYLMRITKNAKPGAEFGAQSRRRQKTTRLIEKPGVTPPILFELIGNTIFLRLADVATNLPTYTEFVKSVPMSDSDTDGSGSQSECYAALQSDLVAAVKAALKNGSKRLLGAYLQALLAWPDNCTKAEVVIDPISGELLGQAPGLPADVLYPKEVALRAEILENRKRGRKTLVYITHTGTRDVGPRVESFLKAAGLRVAYLRADSTAPDKREQWIAERVKEGCDVLLTNPNNVKTGLDLIDFPSIIWMEVDYSTYTLRQASRRSWRIGQDFPVEVTYLVYQGTLQADALSLIASKLRASLMVEGELPDDGLATMGADEADMVLTLARRMAASSNGEVDSRSLEALFAQVAEVANAADGFIADPDWTLPEPEPVVKVLVPAVAADPFGSMPLLQAMASARNGATHGVVPVSVAAPVAAPVPVEPVTVPVVQTMIVGLTSAPRKSAKVAREVAAGQLSFI